MDVGELISSIGVAGVVPVLTYLLKNTIDNFTINAVEKVFLTSFQKFNLFTNQNIIFGAVLGLIYYFLVVDMTEFSWVALIGLMTFFVSILLVSTSLIYLVTSLITVKVRFYFKHDGSYWALEKRVNHDQMLISKGKNCYKFVEINDVYSEVILRVLMKEKKIWFQDFVLKYVKYIWVTYLIFLILTISLNLVDYVNNLWTLIFIIILLMIALIIIIITTNDAIIKEFGWRYVKKSK